MLREYAIATRLKRSHRHVQAQAPSPVVIGDALRTDYSGYATMTSQATHSRIHAPLQATPRGGSALPPRGSPSPIQTEAAIKRGLAFLRVDQATHDGRFGMHAVHLDSGHQQRVDGPFATALTVSLLLDGHSDNHRSSLVSDSAAFLLRQRRPDGLFSFFGADSDYPEDIDDTVCCWHSLLQLNPSIRRSVPIRSITSNVDDRGRLLTWFRPDRDNVLDWVVIANALRLLWSLGVRAPVSEMYLESIIAHEQYKPTGSPYYRDPMVALALVSMCLDWPAGQFLLRYAPKVSAFLQDSGANCKPATLPALALALTRWTSIPDTISGRLIDAQLVDGGWPESLLFRHLQRPIGYYSRAVSTAFAIAALTPRTSKTSLENDHADN